MRVRRAVAQRIKEHIRDRVGRRGMGAEGKLAGYSTNPLVISPGPKRRVKPRRGWHSFHRGGYRQYRKEAGLEHNIFVFDNKGAAWRDWMGATQEQEGTLNFGFARDLNQMAADAAIARGREDMFDLNEGELEEFAEAYLEEALDDIWGKN